MKNSPNKFTTSERQYLKERLMERGIQLGYAAAWAHKLKVKERDAKLAVLEAEKQQVESLITKL